MSRPADRLTPDEREAICEDCGEAFIVKADDLLACRELKSLRARNPESMSRRAGAILCPLHAYAAWAERHAVRWLDGPGRQVKEEESLHGADRKLFQDWLVMLRRSARPLC